jgi:hypothetical protein
MTLLAALLARPLGLTAAIKGMSTEGHASSSFILSNQKHRQ